MYIFILDLLTSGFKVFGKDSHKTVRESFKCWDLVRLILDTWRYIRITRYEDISLPAAVVQMLSYICWW